MVQIMQCFVYLWRNLTPEARTVIEFFFAEAFFGSDQPGDKISYSGEGSKFGGGSEGCLCTGPPSATLLIRSKMLILQLLSVIHRSKYNIKSCILSYKRGRRYKDSDIWFRIHLVPTCVINCFCISLGRIHEVLNHL